MNDEVVVVELDKLMKNKEMMYYNLLEKMYDV
jgi:hypothetical protein